MKFLNLFFIILITSSCIKDKPQEPLKTAISINAETKVLVINEGNYGWNLGQGNSSISVYDPPSNSVIENYYGQQNNNSALGDVCQSITKYNNNYYIVINNSNKIEVVNDIDFKKTATITGLSSPRYLLPITYNKAYVSDIHNNGIYVINLNTNTIMATIPCLKGTQQMALIYNKAFVTNDNSNYCYVINTTTDVVTDSINVGYGASSIVIDKNSKIWVLTGSISASNQLAKLVCINAITLQIETSFNFTLGQTPHNLCLNKTHDTLYFINNGVYQQPITNNQLSNFALIAQGNKTYYGLGVNTKDYNIYVSDASNFTQKSTIEIYNAAGSFLTSFKAGIISNGFVFE